MFNEKNEYLIPPIILQKGETILKEGSEPYAAQFEQIILYCQDVLNRYEKKTGLKRHK